MGAIEHDKCDFCKQEKSVQRTYLHSKTNLKVDSIIIRTCLDCGLPYDKHKVFPQKYENSERYLREGDVCRTLDADESNYGEAIYEIYIWIDHINAYMWIDVDDLAQMILTKDDPKIIEEEFGDMFGEYMSYTIATHMENRKYLGHITEEVVASKLDPTTYKLILPFFKLAK